MKTIICIKPSKAQYPFAADLSDQVLRVTTISPYLGCLRKVYAIIDHEKDTAYIMKNIGVGHYQIYGCDAVYKVFRPRKMLIRAFQKRACKWDMTKRDARRWAKSVSDCYFDNEGNAIPEMIDYMREFVEDDGTINVDQELFDNFACEEILCW